MLDTVILMLDRSQFHVSEPQRFDPPADALLSGNFMPGKGAIKAIQNPSKESLRQGIYSPRLTLVRRKVTGGSTVSLKIEFSIPKLLYGNNFDEISEADFDLVLDRLEFRLFEMGVKTRYEYLRDAKVSGIHFGKNVCMLDHASCALVMEEVGKIHLNARLDLNKTDYRNGGSSIRFHANNQEFIIYDKKKDLQAGSKSEKRSHEKDYAVQQDLFDWGQYPRQLEILRLEARITNRIKLKSLIKKLDIKAELRHKGQK